MSGIASLTRFNAPANSPVITMFPSGSVATACGIWKLVLVPNAFAHTNGAAHSFASQMRLSQSLPTSHERPLTHGSQSAPPQSSADSEPFFTLSVHDGAHIPDSHTPPTQSDAWTHPFPG